MDGGKANGNGVAGGAHFRRIAGWALLVFAAASLGFGVSREIMRGGRPAATPVSAANRPDSAAPRADRVVVYYMHQAFRCVTCRKMEEMAWRAVHEDFADAMSDGRVEWRTVNFHERRDLAERYDLVASSVVVSKVRGGREVKFEKLDRTWQLLGDPPAFRSYITGAVRSLLEGD